MKSSAVVVLVAVAVAAAAEGELEIPAQGLSWPFRTHVVKAKEKPLCTNLVAGLLVAEWTHRVRHILFESS